MTNNKNARSVAQAKINKNLRTLGKLSQPDVVSKPEPGKILSTQTLTGQEIGGSGEAAAPKTRKFTGL